MTQHEILLDSGTNEAEFLEFYLGAQSFGINVAKVQSVLQFDPKCVTKLPYAPASICGTYLHRDRTITLVDLGKELRSGQGEEAERRIVMLAEFNGAVTGFLVDGIDRIHRISWDMIQPMNKMLGGFQSRMTGVISIDEREILIVDMEAVVECLFPDTGIQHIDLSQERPLGREDVRVMLAEDSGLIRSTISKILRNGGYEKLSEFDDGLAAWEEIGSLVADGDPLPHVLVSDIEMPRMDGLTLCRNIKEGKATEQISVLFFSSLINDQMATKCEQVGGSGQITKPEIGGLVKMIDEMCLQPAAVMG